MKYATVHITQLLLDPENPRHDVIENQKEIIKQLLATEKIDNLAKDIAEQGSLSPLESVGVIPLDDDEDEYIVVEGNRRVCACLLLNNPDLCPTDSTKVKFEKIKGKSKIPDKVNCTVFDSREDADHWIQLRHEGQLDGRGTKSWSAQEIARYAEKRGRNNPNSQAIKLLDFAVQHAIIADDEKKYFNVTTLQRYLSNPVVRNVLGLQNRVDLKSKQDLETFKRLVTQFLADARPLEDGTPGEVNSRSKGDDWRAYANKLQKEISDPPPEDNPIADHAESHEDKKEEPAPNKPLLKKSKQDPAKRKCLIPYNVKFSIEDKILNRVYLEMRRLEVEGFEFCAAYLIRSFVEGTIVLYMQKYLPQDLQRESKLNQKILKVCDHLADQGVKKGKLNPLRVAASDTNSMLSPFMIGAFVHLSVIPTKRELLSIWDRLEDILTTIHELLA